MAFGHERAKAKADFGMHLGWLGSTVCFLAILFGFSARVF